MNPMNRWIVDEDGDIGISLFWDTLIIIKYKTSCIYRWFVVYEDAKRYSGHNYGTPFVKRLLNLGYKGDFYKKKLSNEQYNSRVFDQVRK